jgi:metal-responsive CopG/Arc/MetJ family transcriptional regulator
MESKALGTTVVTVVIPDVVLKKLDKWARDEDRSRSAQIRRIVEAAIEQHESAA